MTANVNNNPIEGLIEYLWLGSDGFAIFVERFSPLFFRQSDSPGEESLCFSGDYSKSPYNHAIDTNETKIVLHLMSGNDILHVYKYAANQWIKKPKGIPDQRMITYPIW